MDEFTSPQDGFTDVGGLIRAMRSSLEEYWAQAQGYQRFLYYLGALLLATAVFQTGVLLLTGGSLEGPVSWRKPIVFGEAFGLTAVAVAWVMTYLPKHRIRGWLLAGSLGLASAGEVFLVSLQQWRGVPSHFNFSTPFDTAVFSTMGFLVVFTEIVIIVVALWTFIALQAPRSLAWAIRFGMVLLVAGQVFGNLIIQNGIAKVIDFETGAFMPEAVATASVFGAAGSMKVPHALTLHGIEVLPLLAWLLAFTHWSESRRTRIVTLATGGYTGLVVVSAFQTFSGLAPLDMTAIALIVLGVGAVVLIASYAAALLGLQRTIAQPAT